MRLNLKRVLAGAALAATAASLVPLAMASPAAAAPSLQGPADVRTPGGGAPLNSGTSATNFTLRLPTGAACGGDATVGYRIQAYMVPSTVSPATLTFDSNGPVPFTFGSPQSAVRLPLYDTFGSPYLAFPAAAATPGGPGLVINIPDFTYSVWTPGDIPAGSYNVGIACVLPPSGGGAATVEEYWNNQVTFTANAGDGFANVNWAVGAPASAPTLDSVTPGNGTCAAAFTPGVSSPAATSFTATATGPGGPFTATGASSPLTITGLTNFSAYSVTVTATSPAGTSVASNALSCTPSVTRTNVSGVSVTPGAPGSGLATVNWIAPAPNSPAADPTGYLVVVTGPTPSSTTVLFGTNTLALSGLTAGSYAVTVDAQYADAPTTGSPASTSVAFAIAASGLPGSVLQHIDVTRPVGALVLTQVCGVNGALAAVAPAAYTGFGPGLPAVAASSSSTVIDPTSGGTTPTLTEDGADADPNRPEYPYPTNALEEVDANYPTHCGLDLGRASFVRRGAGAGQFFAASGVLNQVTIVDTRDDDPGWAVTGDMSDFAANGGTDTFSGSQLGWLPRMTEDTGPFTDSLGNTYDQTVTAGGPVGPNSPVASGLSSGATLASSTAADGLGTAILDARLLLLIPVTADAGDYRGTLTITAT